MKIIIMLSLALLVLCTRAKATDSIYISHLSVDQGLSNNSVRCIFKDHLGFMWFGTYDGLNRYDGYGFKVFRNNLSDSNSLPGNYINSIQEFGSNHLWIGTGQGIGIYNTLTSKFSPAYFVPWQQKKKQRIRTTVNDIKLDENGNLLICSNGLGFLVQEKNKDAAQQIQYTNNTGQKKGSIIQACVIDKRKKVWLFIGEVGLCSYDYTTKKIMLENNAFTYAFSMECDKDNNLFIGCSKGLFKYETHLKTMSKIYGQQSGQLTSDKVIKLMLDGNQKLWLGTNGGGVNILDIRQKKIDYITAGEGYGHLSSANVSDIFEDNEGRVWIGTVEGGINIISAKKSPFITFSHSPSNPNSLAQDFVSTFCEGGGGELLIGTNGGGISFWDRAKNSFSNIQHNIRKQNSLSANDVSSIIKEPDGSFWIATRSAGIDRYNKKTGRFDHYRCINPSNGGENHNVRLLFEDRERTLWAASFGGGWVYRYNRLQDRFEIFDYYLRDILSLAQDKDGKIWAGNFHQLIRLSEKGKQHQYFEIGRPVRAISEDKKGNLLLGTEGGGLVLFDKINGRILARYSEEDGMPSNSVLNIITDHKGDLWMGTYNGLSRYNIAKRRFNNYFYADGLQSNQFSYNAALRLGSGELVFGGVKGFTIFDPDSVNVDYPMPPVFITRLAVDGKLVWKGDGIVSESNDTFITGLRIPYDKAALSFDFAALEYSVPYKISYAYFLEGWDRDWNYSGNIRTANYTLLKEGSYHLHIKCSNGAGLWNPKEILLKIVVLPPWYQSWWAYLIYVSLIALLIYKYFHYKNKQDKLKLEVRVTNMAMEKEKELNEKKLSFFTEMSHEFRTPLTLIINPVKDLLVKFEKNSPFELGIVNRNAKRLLGLVDQLLLFKKVDEGAAANLQLSKTDYTLLCREVYECFVQEARSKRLTYTLTIPEKLYAVIDAQKIEIAIYNLLSNAMKYTPDDGSVCIEVVEKDNKVITKVKDNGIGIPQNAGDSIFQKFNRGIGKSNLGPGFGIGLYLVKNVIDAHDGDIFYESMEDKGSSFIFTFPKGDVGIEQKDKEKPPLANILTVDEAGLDKEDWKDEILTKEKTILIVDDDDQMRNYLIDIFSGMYIIFSAVNGWEGLQVAKEQLPDLVISDIVMDKMDGMEMCKIIKSDPAISQIPIILLTGNHSTEGQLLGVGYGADDYITKPFVKELLVVRVDNLLKKKSILQHYFYNEITLQKNTLNVSEEYKVFLEKCIAIVEAHLDDDRLNVQLLASEIGMSYPNLYKKIKSISGQSVNAFIRFIRLRKAAELLINTDMNVTETACHVGLGSPKYFREQFNKLFGINPSEYIKKYRKAFGRPYRLNKDILGEDGESK